MKVKPLDDRVLVKPMESEEKTEGGIVLPDTAKEKPVKGTIEAVGGGKVLKNGTRQALSLKVGDRVIYGKYSGHDIKIDGIEYKIMKEDDVLARIEE